MTQTITRMNPGSLPDAGQAGYSQISIVEPGRLAFVSGRSPGSGMADRCLGRWPSRWRL